MKPKICLRIEDGYADVYALHTLYDFLVENQFDADFKIYSMQTVFLERFNKCIEESGIGEGFKLNRELTKPLCGQNIILKGYCDARGNYRCENDRELAIDHAVLKNCVKPLAEDKRKELKRKYEIPEDRTILVIGCPIENIKHRPELKIVVDEIKKDCLIYIAGSIGAREYCLESIKERVKIIDERGILKDYYSIADIAITNTNLHSGIELSPLHNFVESCAGGPLFLVEPDNKLQYGYKELTNLGVIREAKDTKDLVDRINNYLENPNSSEVRRLRREHLERARNLYLRDILKLINKCLGKPSGEFESDLVADSYSTKRWLRKSYQPRIRVYHPDTVWDFGDASRTPKPLNSIPQKVYELFGRTV